MLYKQQEIEKFITENFPEVSDYFIDRSHITDFCPVCNTSMGLQILVRNISMKPTRYGLDDEDWEMPYTIVLQCPSCKSKRIWVLYQKYDHEVDKKFIYKLLSIPGEGKYDIPELPNEPPSLKSAYLEAIRCMDANCPMAAATMFRRALQIITREILGATPGKLVNELKELVGKENKLGIVLTNDFHKNGYIVRRTGNQAAHPDKDLDLLEFTSEDAKDLYNIFLEMVTELFVVPSASQKARESILKRRKL